jgi:hypothetical protein
MRRRIAPVILTLTLFAAFGPSLAAPALAAKPPAATWSIVPSQAVGTRSALVGVVALSTTDGWAVGTSGNGLVERWNGTGWSIVPSPDIVDHSNANTPRA